MHKKTKISDEGSIVLILIIVLVIAVVVGSLFYVVGSQTDKKVVTSFEECAALGNPIREIYPEQCVADGKTFTNPKQKIDDTDVQKSTRVFKIPEFGVQFDSPTDLSGLYYVKMSESPNTVRFSLEEYKGTDCAADQSSLLALSKLTNEEVDNDLLLKDSKSSLNQVNSFYYVVQGSKSLCGENMKDQQKASIVTTDIYNAIKNTLTSIQ
jgi:hypothetical protein